MRAPSRNASARSPPGRRAGTTSYSSRYVATSVSTSASLASSMARTRSPTPYPSVEKPSRRMASTLSPSVTATSRMFSPNRAIRPPSQSWRARAARAHVPIRSWTSGSDQWPATIVRSRRSRAAMNPNSRSPWAAWWRFMKSMSMVAHGMWRWCCVWRCRNGLCRPCRPAIHILAGENVCIHTMRPTQAGSRSASWHSARMPAASVRTGLTTTRAGMPASGIERGGDVGAVLGDRPQRVRAVQVLAARHEPDLGRRQADDRTGLVDGAAHWPYTFV